MKKTKHRRGLTALCALTTAMLCVPAAAHAVVPMGAMPTAAAGSHDASAVDEAGEPSLPETVDPSITPQDTLVADGLVVTPDGVVKDIETGEAVVDPQIVGTEDAPPDPLVKSGGESFIPVDVGDLLPSHADTGAEQGSAAPTASSARTGGALAVSPAALPLGGNDWGVRWGEYNSTPAFFDGTGALFVQQAEGVIDVSEHQGDIDWAAVKNAGVDGAIIRIGFGSGNRIDAKAIRNISECRRLGIPFGIYLYSYVEEPADGTAEAKDIIAKLSQAGVGPAALSYPVYYDLEKYTWVGHPAPTDPAVWAGAVENWWSTMKNAGYANLAVYSYSSYLRTALKASSIHEKTQWVASYGQRTGFDFPANRRAWQYTSEGSVAGIVGNVDLNAFGNAQYKAPVNLTWMMRDEDIAVGVSAYYPAGPVEYKFSQYNLDTQQWKVFQDWNAANWAGWATDEANYWLHVEVRDARTKRVIGTQTIAFRYQAGTTALDGTYAGWRSDGILLGAVSKNPKARTEIQIYDYQKKKWVAQFDGPWALWKPTPGVYWTHFRVFTSDGRLAKTLTYPFGV